MGERRRGHVWVAVVVGLLAPFLVPEAASSVPSASTAASPYRCGARDRPETGVHGDVPQTDQLSGRADQGYNCGLAVVGHDPLGNRGGNANMAWSGDCAYIAGDGVAVVDVRDPAHPKHVRTLHGPGSDATIETLHAVDAPGRSLLVTGRYGLFGHQSLGGSGPVDVWDVRDCARPKRITTFSFPYNVHNLTLTADGKRLWSTLPLQAADLTDPRHPKVLPDIESQVAAGGAFHLQYAHEVWPSPDGKRIYFGGQEAVDEAVVVLDVEGWPKRPARVVSQISHPGHSVRPMTIDGKPFLLASDESIINPTAKGCLPNALTPFGGASRPSMIDISHEQRPRIRSVLSIEINEPLHCVDQVLSGVNASVHYQDVDNADDTTFAMVSAWNAGLRIFDVRDASHPREVAYFNPGRWGLDLDQAWAHIRYRQDTGHIWLTTSSGGFWVLELEPQVRAALGLSKMKAAHPNGAVPRPASTQRVVAAPIRLVQPSTYCALSTARIL